MSKEFFEIMEKVEKVAKDIKFLENEHPELSSEFIRPANQVLNSVCKLEMDIVSDLRALHSKTKKVIKNGRPKSKSKN